MRCRRRRVDALEYIALRVLYIGNALRQSIVDLSTSFDSHTSRFEPRPHASRLCGKGGVWRIILDSIVDFPGACWGLGGENAGRGRGRGKNFPGVGLAEKRGYDSDEDQEPQPRFFSSRIHHLSGLELAAKRRRCKARMCHDFPPRW